MRAGSPSTGAVPRKGMAIGAEKKAQRGEAPLRLGAGSHGCGPCYSPYSLLAAGAIGKPCPTGGRVNLSLSSLDFPWYVLLL